MEFEEQPVIEIYKSEKELDTMLPMPNNKEAKVQPMGKSLMFFLSRQVLQKEDVVYTRIQQSGGSRCIAH